MTIFLNLKKEIKMEEKLDYFLCSESAIEDFKEIFPDMLYSKPLKKLQPIMMI
jgi:hypothetical protein